MAANGPVGIGVIGAGVISQTYLENLGSFPDTKVVAVGDLVTVAAKTRAQEFDIATSGGPEAVLDNDDVEIVVNLTIPAAHAQVATSALEAGKHVWNEKPLSLDRASGRALLDLADSRGLRVGCAPDTFLGSGQQAVRRIIERGDIGVPLTALTLMQSPGPESWHPNPAFLFQAGAGPLFDIGPYYLTALVQVFGPVAKVAGVGSRSREKRVIGSGPKAGEEFEVTVPTHVSAMVVYETKQSSQSIFSFDSALKRIQLEVTGSDGTLEIPDPNMFDGNVRLRTATTEDWTTLETTTAQSSRGTGVLDMARAIREDRPHRAQGALAYHVLDTMVAISESVETGQFADVASTVGVPDPLPADWDPGAATV